MNGNVKTAVCFHQESGWSIIRDPSEGPGLVLRVLADPPVDGEVLSTMTSAKTPSVKEVEDWLVRSSVPADVAAKWASELGPEWTSETDESNPS